MYLYKTTLKFLETMWNNVFGIFSANKLLFYKKIKMFNSVYIYNITTAPETS